MAVLDVRAHSETILRLERGAHRRLHPLVGDQIQTEALHKHSEHRLEFHHGKRGAQASAGTRTKGKVGAGGVLFPMHRIEALGPEDVWLGKLFGHAMADVGGVHDDIASVKSITFPLEWLTRNARKTGSRRINA